VRIDVAIQVTVWASNTNIRENVFSDTTTATFTRRHNKEMSIQHEGRKHCGHYANRAPKGSNEDHICFQYFRWTNRIFYAVVAIARHFIR
jgi:hypothetical protein